MTWLRKASGYHRPRLVGRELEISSVGPELEDRDGKIEVVLVGDQLEMGPEETADLGRRRERIAGIHQGVESVDRRVEDAATGDDTQAVGAIREVNREPGRRVSGRLSWRETIPSLAPLGAQKISELRVRHRRNRRRVLPLIRADYLVVDPILQESRSWPAL